MGCHPSDLLGHRWIGKRLRKLVRRGDAMPRRARMSAPSGDERCALESLESRVLFSVDTGVGELIQYSTEPDEAVVNELQPNVAYDGSGVVVSDGFTVPDEAQDASTLDTDPGSPEGPSSAPPSGQVPFGADYRDGSEFMVGDVWVTVVLTESNGVVDASTEDWTQTEIDSVKSEVLEGLTWWEDTFAAQNSLHDLNFFVDFTYADNPVATDYEPISRPQSQEAFWVDDFLDGVGYNTSSSIFVDLDNWNHDQRVANSTDWAFTLFVADSSADGDGRFSDGFFAYAYRGGPFTQLTYDNATWGISRFGQVLAHETGHIFYALDEYAGGSSYNTYSGYYKTQNLNAKDDNPNPGSRSASIMAEASLQNNAWANHTSAPSTLEMLGWKDSDNDGIFDVLDVPLTLTGTGSYNDTAGRYEFSGDSFVNTLNNLNTRGTKHDITLNTVDRLQYRIDGGGWIDGNAYGDFSTSVSQNVTIADSGTHTIDFRTIVEQTGLSSNLWSDTFTADNTNEIPGITVTPISGLVTTEAGGTATFSIKLDTKPTGNVIIGISSNDTSEGTVDKSTLTFKQNNWNQAQTVTVTGVNDAVDDGNVAYTIITAAATSNDSNYNGLNAANVAVTNTDNDTAGIIVTPTSGLLTTEAGATTSFGVKLKSQPTSNVTIGISSNDTTEGTVNKSSLVFTPSNWNTQQTVTITGVNDFVDDGNVGYSIVTNAAVSNDSNYNGVNAANVNVTNSDNDTAGIIVSPTSGLITTEAGGTATFSVKLNTKPTANVTIVISSNDTSEGTVDKTTLTFKKSNWNQEQVVTITGVDDALFDNDAAYTITLAPAVSTDSNYGGLDASDVSVTNTNDDFVAAASLSAMSSASVTSSSATLNGEVLDTGGEDPQVHIVWGTTDGGSDLGLWENDVDLGVLGTGPFSTGLTGLADETTYFFRSYAVNSAGTVWVGTTSFVTDVAAIPSEVDNTGLIAHWKFDESNGSTAADSSPFGKSNTGTLNSNAVFNPTGGQFGGAVVFDGNSDHVHVADSSDINLTTVSQRTISLWFNADDVNINSRKQVLYEEGGTNYGLNIYLHDGNMYVGGWKLPAWSGFISTGQVQSGQWHHVALVIDAPSSIVQPNVLIGYLDGVSFGSEDGRSILSHGGDIGIGAANFGVRFHDNTKTTGDGHGFAGKIDEARIYNRVLDGNEVQILANGGGIVTAASLGTISSTSVTSSSATLNGEVLNTGGEDPQVHIVWGTTDGGTNPGLWDNNVDLGVLGTGSFSTDITGLTAETTYFFRSYAVNSVGAVWADTTSFVTDIAPAGSDVDPTGLVAHWTFDETNGSTATDSSTSGQDHTGTLKANAVFNPTGGQFGGAVVFDGTSDHVEVDDSSEINLTTVSQRTISLWFNVDDVNINSRKQVLYEEGGTTRGLSIYLYDGNLYVGGWSFSGWSGTFINTDQVQSGQWHHVAFVMNTTSTIQPNTLTGYLDGVSFGSGDGMNIISHGGDIGIGGANHGVRFHDNTKTTGDGHGFAGKIDEARIYNRVLDSNEIQTLASTNLGGGATAEAPNQDETVNALAGTLFSYRTAFNFRSYSRNLLTVGPSMGAFAQASAPAPRWRLESVDDGIRRPWLRVHNRFELRDTD